MLVKTAHALKQNIPLNVFAQIYVGLMEICHYAIRYLPWHSQNMDLNHKVSFYWFPQYFIGRKTGKEKILQSKREIECSENLQFPPAQISSNKVSANQRNN